MYHISICAGLLILIRLGSCGSPSHRLQKRSSPFYEHEQDSETVRLFLPSGREQGIPQGEHYSIRSVTVWGVEEGFRTVTIPEGNMQVHQLLNVDSWQNRTFYVELQVSGGFSYRMRARVLYSNGTTIHSDEPYFPNITIDPHQPDIDIRYSRGDGNVENYHLFAQNRKTNRYDSYEIPVCYFTDPHSAQEYQYCDQIFQACIFRTTESEQDHNCLLNPYFGVNVTVKFKLWTLNNHSADTDLYFLDHFSHPSTPNIANYSRNEVNDGLIYHFNPFPVNARSRFDNLVIRCELDQRFLPYVDENVVCTKTSEQTIKMSYGVIWHANFYYLAADKRGVASTLTINTYWGFKPNNLTVDIGQPPHERDLNISWHNPGGHRQVVDRAVINCTTLQPVTVEAQGGEYAVFSGWSHAYIRGFQAGSRVFCYMWYLELFTNKRSNSSGVVGITTYPLPPTTFSIRHHYTGLNVWSPDFVLSLTMPPAGQSVYFDIELTAYHVRKDGSRVTSLTVSLKNVSGFNDNGQDMIWTWPNTSAIHPGAKYGVELVVIGLEGRKRTLGYNETIIIDPEPPELVINFDYKTYERIRTDTNKSELVVSYHVYTVNTVYHQGSESDISIFTCQTDTYVLMQFGECNLTVTGLDTAELRLNPGVKYTLSAVSRSYNVSGKAREPSEIVPDLEAPYSVHYLEISQNNGYRTYNVTLDFPPKTRYRSISLECELSDMLPKYIHSMTFCTTKYIGSSVELTTFGGLHYEIKIKVNGFYPSTSTVVLTEPGLSVAASPPKNIRLYAYPAPNEDTVNIKWDNLQNQHIKTTNVQCNSCIPRSVIKVGRNESACNFTDLTAGAPHTFRVWTTSHLDESADSAMTDNYTVLTYPKVPLMNVSYVNKSSEGLVIYELRAIPLLCTRYDGLNVTCDTEPTLRTVYGPCRVVNVTIHLVRVELNPGVRYDLRVQISSFGKLSSPWHHRIVAKPDVPAIEISEIKEENAFRFYNLTAYKANISRHDLLDITCSPPKELNATLQFLLRCDINTTGLDTRVLKLHAGVIYKIKVQAVSYGEQSERLRGKYIESLPVPPANISVIAKPVPQEGTILVTWQNVLNQYINSTIITAACSRTGCIMSMTQVSPDDNEVTFSGLKGATFYTVQLRTHSLFNQLNSEWSRMKVCTYPPQEKSFSISYRYIGTSVESGNFHIDIDMPDKNTYTAGNIIFNILMEIGPKAYKHPINVNFSGGTIKNKSFPELPEDYKQPGRKYRFNMILHGGNGTITPAKTENLIVKVPPSQPVNVTLLHNPESPLSIVTWDLSNGSIQDAVAVRVCSRSLCPEEMFIVRKVGNILPNYYNISSLTLAQELNYTFYVSAISDGVEGPASKPANLSTEKLCLHPTDIAGNLVNADGERTWYFVSGRSYYISCQEGDKLPDDSVLWECTDGLWLRGKDCRAYGEAIIYLGGGMIGFALLAIVSGLVCFAVKTNMKKRERVWEQEEKTLDKQSTLYGALSKEAAARIIAQNEVVRHSMAVTGEIVRRGIPGRPSSGYGMIARPPSRQSPQGMHSYPTKDSNNLYKYSYPTKDSNNLYNYSYPTKDSNNLYNFSSVRQTLERYT